ncbi:MAG: transcription antitermination protein NusB [Rhodospirillales bacterium]|nr:transcription antitermination protein NusB [Rhodospirillales bacterium]
MSKDQEQVEDTSSPKAKALSARLSAVQALYQMSQNEQSVRVVLDDYLHSRSGMEIDGQRLIAPDGALLKKILFGVDERRTELEAVIDANLKKDAQDRDVEPLLRAILVCGAYELLVQDIDKAIIINDYLNVAHGFYERSEVALVNGVLDSVAHVFE